jgi:hypothetical protein
VHPLQKLGITTLSFPSLWRSIKYNPLGSLRGHTGVLGVGVAASVRGRLNDVGGIHLTMINASDEADVFLTAMRSQGLPQLNASRSIPAAFFTRTSVTTITTFGQMLTDWVATQQSGRTSQGSVRSTKKAQIL